MLNYFGYGALTLFGMAWPVTLILTVIALFLAFIVAGCPKIVAMTTVTDETRSVVIYIGNIGASVGLNRHYGLWIDNNEVEIFRFMVNLPSAGTELVCILPLLNFGLLAPKNYKSSEKCPCPGCSGELGVSLEAVLEEVTDKLQRHLNGEPDRLLS